MWRRRTSYFATVVGAAILLTVAPASFAIAWEMYRSKSAMTDTDDVQLRVKSSSSVEDQLGLGSVTPVLVIACIENRTRLYVDWHRYITTGGLEGTHSVRYRVDQDKAKTVNWSLSTDFEATGLWSGGQSIPLIKRLITAKQLVVETTPYGSNTVRATFVVAGLDRFIPFVQKE